MNIWVAAYMLTQNVKASVLGPTAHPFPQVALPSAGLALIAGLLSPVQACVCDVRIIFDFVIYITLPSRIILYLVLIGFSGL